MKNKITSKDFRVPAGKQVDLKKWPTRVKPIYKSKKNYHKLLESQVTALSALQRLHYASNRYAVLLILQGMDAAGKDGAIRHVMSRVNPQGCQVFSFKQPSAEELEHDFLWRATCRLPERGRIGVFNQKAYEACLSATSTNDAPWHVVPADDKKNARLIISEIVLDVFKGLKMAYPEPTAKRRRELQLIRKTLVK
jgi:polyphosphate kinase 2 (PPK2 family)